MERLIITYMNYTLVLTRISTSRFVETYVKELDMTFNDVAVAKNYIERL